MSNILFRFKALWQLVIIAFFVVIISTPLVAQHDNHSDGENVEPWETEVEEQEFKAGEMIIVKKKRSY